MSKKEEGNGERIEERGKERIEEGKEGMEVKVKN
jgi:hypothetical protein